MQGLMASTFPKVSVVMPAYNAGQYLAESIASVLRQTFSDLELLIIDDGSTDGTGDILAAISDPRVRIASFPNNRGIIAALNEGLSLARGEYIARMDADDVCFRRRFEQQVRFLDRHPEVGILGTAMWVQGRRGHYLYVPEINDDSLKALLPFNCVFAHPTVMMRREVLANAGLAYDTMYKDVEDYGFWLECSKVTRFANLASPLLRYRVHGASLSQAQSAVRLKANRVVFRRALECLGVEPTEEELDIHYSLSLSQRMSCADFLRKSRAWLEGLRSANDAKRIYPHDAFLRRLGDRWRWACLASPGRLRERLAAMMSSRLFEPAIRHVAARLCDRHWWRAWLANRGSV
jgi:hypothetical protein